MLLDSPNFVRRLTSFCGEERPYSSIFWLWCFRLASQSSGLQMISTMCGMLWFWMCQRTKPELTSKQNFKKRAPTHGAQAGIGTFMVWPRTTDSETYILYMMKSPIHTYYLCVFCTYSLSAFLLIFKMICYDCSFIFVFCHRCNVCMYVSLYM